MAQNGTRQKRAAAPVVRPTAQRKRQPKVAQYFDVVIVGAGAAGIGCGVALRDLGVADFVLLEREAIGASFVRWPAEMRFITPSFPSNAFGLMDLNAVAIGTSPAFTLKAEHPTGREYARYLEAVANHWQLPIEIGVDVHMVTPRDSGGFEIQTSRGLVECRFIIWAAGEFQYPRRHAFPGSELALPTANLPRWADLPGDEVLIIGGYESGMDAAGQLIALGKRVTVFDSAPSWDSGSGDPSLSLSPFTHERLRAALATERLTLRFDTPVAAIEHDDAYTVVSARGERFPSVHPPLLATGFDGSLRLIADLFAWSEHGNAQLSNIDESIITPGLFVAGPMVRHPGAIFCFIYKFRQRFAVVAEAIGERLGLDTSPIERYRANQMYLDDLTCCDDACAC